MDFLSKDDIKKIIVYFAKKYSYDWEKIYDALKLKKKASVNFDNCDFSKILTILDEDFPNNLKEIFKPSFILFLEGNKELLKDSTKIISITENFNEDDINKLIDKYGDELIFSLELNANTKKIISWLKENNIKFIAGCNYSLDYFLSKNELEELTNSNDCLFLSEYENGFDNKNIVKKEEQSVNRIINYIADKHFIKYDNSNKNIEIDLFLFSEIDKREIEIFNFEEIEESKKIRLLKYLDEKDVQYKKFIPKEEIKNNNLKMRN